LYDSQQQTFSAWHALARDRVPDLLGNSWTGIISNNWLDGSVVANAAAQAGSGTGTNALTRQRPLSEI
jgi:hypothetical protein